MSKQIRCPNCGECFRGIYCSTCGQKGAPQEVDSSTLKHDILHFFHAEGVFFHTAWLLLISPSNVIHSYLNGRRNSYFGPFSTALTLSGIFIFLYRSGDVDILSVVGQVVFFVEKFVYNGDIGLPDWILEWYAIVELVLLIPISSITSMIVFRSMGMSVYEHLVVNAYLAALRLIVGLFFFPMLYLLDDSLVSEIALKSIAVTEVLVTISGYSSVFYLVTLSDKIRYMLLFMFVFGIQMIALVILFSFV